MAAASDITGIGSPGSDGGNPGPYSVAMAAITTIRSAPRATAGRNGALRRTPPSTYQPRVAAGRSTHTGGNPSGMAAEASTCSRVMTPGATSTARSGSAIGAVGRVALSMNTLVRARSGLEWVLSAGSVGGTRVAVTPTAATVPSWMLRASAEVSSTAEAVVTNGEVSNSAGTPRPTPHIPAMNLGPSPSSRVRPGWA